MSDPRLPAEILRQILDAIGRIERRIAAVDSPVEFLNSNTGLDALDSICMMLIAIGESVKNLDKITAQSLLVRYPEVD